MERMAWISFQGNNQNTLPTLGKVFLAYKFEEKNIHAHPIYPFHGVYQKKKIYGYKKYN